MNRKNRKIGIFSILCFVVGLSLYLVGIILLFSSSLRNISLFSIFFSKLVFTTELIRKLKVLGVILFVIGFIVFMIAVISLYKNNDSMDNHKNLIIEGKADVITLVIMTYVMIFMVVICLLYDELIGALLFGITIVIQTLLNSLLISYYSKMYRKK
ncbi:MAG: hypothetical protein ACI4XM_05765 [Candidatus Coprovivens sp.]